jgi:hypothetical protein
MIEIRKIITTGEMVLVTALRLWPPRSLPGPWACITNALRLLFLAGLLSGASTSGMAQEALPNGQSITPTAAPGAIFNPLNPGLTDYPDFTAGQAVTTAVSPDGTTLLVLTSGYNRNNDASGKVIPRDSTSR